MWKASINIEKSWKPSYGVHLNGQLHHHNRNSYIIVLPKSQDSSKDGGIGLGSQVYSQNRVIDQFNVILQETFSGLDFATCQSRNHIVCPPNLGPQKGSLWPAPPPTTPLRRCDLCDLHLPL